MAHLTRESSDTPSTISEQPTPLLENRDAGFSYQEEKTLQHIEEKLWAHRRGSNASETRLSGLSPALSGRSGSVGLLEKMPGLKLTPDILENESQDSTFLDTDEEDHSVKGEEKSKAAPISAETRAIYQSLQKCLDLRDKYIAISKQRLGDNPQHFDGVFKPKTEDDLQFKPWRLYPRPPPPRWKPNQKNVPGRPKAEELEEFEFEKCEIPGPNGLQFRLDERGVFQVYDEATLNSPDAKPVFVVPTIREYYIDLDFVLGVISDGPTKSFAFRRLQYLASKWNMYSLLHEYQEMADMKSVSHRDFYNIRKVDTHVHHSACMNQKHLLRFIKSKMKLSPDEKVIFRDNKTLTLSEVFDSLRLTAYDLSIDTLDMHAHQDSFHRFDKFNLKYNPIGESRLREIFLKTDNYIHGRYLAELTKEVITDLEASKYQNCEWRISIYGRHISEWDKLAKWVVNNSVYSHNVRWLIQVPRLYDMFKQTGQVESFEDIIKNIFQPLFEVTKNPASHPELHIFLQRVIGFDSVDDESKAERRIYRKARSGLKALFLADILVLQFPYPKLWDTQQSPPYSYWIYYMYANMTSLNSWRRTRGFNTFVLRPHAGEAGDTDHLTCVFLTSHSISHGILLRKVPALQYLFYLRQIGMAMSPLSNNALFLTYERNPIKQFFEIGLNVSLSTDDPLQFHFTKEPLLEEYSVAAHIYKLSQSSLAELARNSVIQSGFEMEVKRHWLGQKWYLPGAKGNDIHKTNVPNIRLEYRHQTLQEELQMIRDYCSEEEEAYLHDEANPILRTDEGKGAQAMAGR